MAPDAREWEVFVRETPANPMRHAGSVSAETPVLARERARELFDRFADDVWLVPAEAVSRGREHDRDSAEEVTTS